MGDKIRRSGGRKIRANRWLTIIAALFLSTIGNASSRALSDDTRDKLDFEGRGRSYVLHRPPQASGQKPMPLVMLLHGGGGNASDIERMSGMNAIANKEGFLSSTRTVRPQLAVDSPGMQELAADTPLKRRLMM